MTAESAASWPGKWKGPMIRCIVDLNPLWWEFRFSRFDRWNWQACLGPVTVESCYG